MGVQAWEFALPFFEFGGPLLTVEFEVFFISSLWNNSSLPSSNFNAPVVLVTILKLKFQVKTQTTLYYDTKKYGIQPLTCAILGKNTLFVS